MAAMTPPRMAVPAAVMLVPIGMGRKMAAAVTPTMAPPPRQALPW